MIDTLCIFEDPQYRHLLPLTYTRPVYDLRCGILTLREKIQKKYPGVPVQLHTRGSLAELVRQQNPGTSVNQIGGRGCLFLNGRLLAGADLATTIPLNGPDAVYVTGETVVAARVSGPEVLRKSLPDAISLSTFGTLPKVETSASLIGYPWDLLNANEPELHSDYSLLSPASPERMKGVLSQGAHLINPGSIVIGQGTKVKPGVVLDADNGPIYIGANATIFPNAVIEGPAFIGDRTLIKIGAKIYENTSIGEMCKVGGEVEASIIHSYSNKQHDGFLGHAYLGMWVNLGADTNNSDLKNNYSTVKVVIDGETVDSGSMFMGLIMGDHSKSSVNSMFNTGTVVGVSSNVFGSGFPPKDVPSFSWGGADALTTYEIGKAIDVARRVMARRKKELTGVEEQMLRAVFELTRKDRRAAGMTE